MSKVSLFVLQLINSYSVLHYKCVEVSTNISHFLLCYFPMGSDSPIEICFFPFVGGGHQIPMIDMARLFASHGVHSTIITTAKHSVSFQKLIDRDQKSGLHIIIHILSLPDNVDIDNVELSATPFTDTSFLQEPLKNFLIEKQPDCIVHDVFHRWSAELIDSTKIPRIVFNGNGCFARCVHESLHKNKVHEKVGSEFEPFLVPGLPDKIEMTISQFPIFLREGKKPNHSHGRLKPEDNCFGMIVNSFHELETSYVDHFRNEFGNKVWLVGPVSLCNKNIADKAERGQKTSLDEQTILNWLGSKQPNSVLYISFGSAARLSMEQLLEIAHGLEVLNHSFIWVIGKIFQQNPGRETENVENWLPEGFKERMENSRKGLIIRGWAPQLLILEHPAVGGFLTHCGWNSTLEGVSAGVPMITWPISAEQFSNEKLITNVLKIGIKVGSMNWISWDMEPGVDVKRERVEEAVKKLMSGDDDALEMRERAKELGEKAKRAVENGGSSYKDVENLIEDLKSRKRSQ